MKANSYKIWTDDETNTLIKLFVEERKTKNEICIILNRPYHSIKKKLKTLKLLCTNEQISKSKSMAFSGSKNGMYGKASWSKGQTKEHNESLKKASMAQIKTKKELSEKGLLPSTAGSKNGMYGKTAWCKGLTKDTCESLKRSAEKQSITRKIMWNNLSEKEKNRRIEILLAGFKKYFNKKSRTSIEIKIEKYLLEDLKLIKGVDFIAESPSDYFIFDFYFPKLNLVIECQGDYYHANPRKYNEDNLNSTQKANIKRDIRKKEYLIKNNIKSLFIWEYDINKNFNDIKENIIKFLVP